MAYGEFTIVVEDDAAAVRDILVSTLELWGYSCDWDNPWAGTAARGSVWLGWLINRNRLQLAMAEPQPGQTLLRIRRVWGWSADGTVGHLRGRALSTELKNALVDGFRSAGTFVSLLG